MSRLGPVAYLILGLIGQKGQATPYELKREVAQSIGHFWSFPHSQLYAEPERLTQQGLLTEVREETGRKRRYFRLTGAGRAALAEWLADGSFEASEIRSPALLKLFFGGLTSERHMLALAQNEVVARREQLESYKTMLASFAVTPESRFPLMTLRMGIAYEQASLDFWSAVRDELSEAED